MPPYHRRTTVARRSGARRKTVWATDTFSAPTTIAAGVQNVFGDLLSGLEAGGVGIIGGTILRTHVRFDVSGTAADTRPGLYWGLIVWDKSQAGTVPNPSSDFYVDWSYLTRVVPGSHGPIVSASSAILYSDNADVRSKRRLHEMNDSYFLTAFNQGTQNALVSLMVRTLIALP